MRTRSFAPAILCVAGCLIGLALSPAATAAVPPFDSVRQIVQHTPSAIAHSADGNTLYVAFGATLGVLDATDRTQPALLGGVAPLPPSQVAGVVVNPGAPRYVYAAVANWIFVVDVAVPAAPALVGQTLLSGSATGLALSGNYLFAVGTGTMWVLNTTAANARRWRRRTPSRAGRSRTRSRSTARATRSSAAPARSWSSTSPPPPRPS